MPQQDGTVLCPGSYDPVTNGHLDIIARSSQVFEQVVVCVVDNPLRKDRTLFTAEERKAFIEEATAEAGNVSVRIFSNLLVELARELGAKAIVKGLRAISDFEYEFEMALMNKHLHPDLETLFMMTDQKYFYVSSSRLKELARFGGDIEDFVPPVVAKMLREMAGSS